MEIKIKKSHVLIFLGALILVAGGTAWASRNSRPMTPYAGVKGADLPTVVGEPSIGGPKIPFHEDANYKEYTPEILSAALESGNATLLYFYADWCGTCRAQEPIHEEFFHRAEKEKLPLMGIRINVDTNQPLMRKYGINYQHSYVLLDKTGKPVSKFFGDHSEEDLMREVAKIL